METGRRKDLLSIHWAWVVLGTCFITLLINYSIRIGAYPILLPEMIKDLHLTKAQAGLIKSAFAITYLVFAPIMGWLTDRVGGRKVISFFCLFLGGGAFLMGKAESLLASVIFFAIVGLGASAMWVPSATLIQKWFGTNRRAVALGILNASSGAGFGLMGLFLPVIVIEYNWRFGWFILGIAGLSLFVLDGLLLRDRPKDMGLSPCGGMTGETRGKDFSKRVSYLQILKQRQFWVVGISYLLVAYASYALIDFIVTYGKMELNIPYGIASLFITVAAFTGIPGGILIMILSGYIGTKKSLGLTYTLVALSILFVIFSGNNIPLLIVGVGWFGVLYGGIFPLVAACARDYFPKEITGTVLGLLTIFYGLGAMASPIVTGHLADVTGTFRWSFGLGACLSLFSAFWIGFLRKSKEFEEGED
jgi:OFA family oxalate/formate antiporter-like MFS transporter